MGATFHTLSPVPESHTWPWPTSASACEGVARARLRKHDSTGAGKVVFVCALLCDLWTAARSSDGKISSVTVEDAWPRSRRRLSRRSSITWPKDAAPCRCPVGRRRCLSLAITSQLSPFLSSLQATAEKPTADGCRDGWDHMSFALMHFMFEIYLFLFSQMKMLFYSHDLSSIEFLWLHVWTSRLINFSMCENTVLLSPEENWPSHQRELLIAITAVSVLSY